jgi:phosphoglycerate dehydrogenase-like enzyme
MGIPELVEGDMVLTNMQRVYATEIADQAIGYLLAFTRSLAHFIRAQPAQEWRSREPGVVLDELMGKTLVVSGSAASGARSPAGPMPSACASWPATPRCSSGRLYVEELHRPDAFHSLLPRADVVASAVPLTKQSRGMIAAREFAMMTRGVILINVSRGKVVDTTP